ncbi:MAG TPA: large conductance mechanosensitive channel protein MscL [Anaerolineales bacterium]|nr:large conductance mechanosensitive channel protein MscL [Anaerolineales bacterium]
MLKDFRDFISRGSVINLAIGVILGAAFTAIVNSLVEDMFMPLIGALLGGIDFESLVFQVGEASINYGLFIQAVINFLLVALILFFALRAILAVEYELGSEDDNQTDAEPEPADDIQLLTEIRDLLKESTTINAD